MTPEERAADLDGIGAALRDAFPDRAEELLAETTLALWPFSFVCWVCSVDWEWRSSVCGSCRRTCRALVEQARAGRDRPPADMVISELARALRGAEHPHAESLLDRVRQGLRLTREQQAAPRGTPAGAARPESEWQGISCRLCERMPPIRQLDAIGHGRRVCSACVVRIATAGDGPLLPR